LLISVEVVKPTEEQGPEVVGTGTGNCLDAANAVLCDGGGVFTQYKARSSGGKFWKAGYRKVFVVESGIVQQDLRGLSVSSVKSDMINNIIGLQVTRVLTFLTTGKTHGLELLSL
jgi:hypothetical protein